MCAVEDALAQAGVAGLAMPATPERVWRALRGRDADGHRPTDPG
jgi:hypothetical protein